jgi:hypothetical protein
MKVQGYKEEQPRKIIEACSALLQSLPNGDFLATHWMSDWEPVLAGAAEQQRSVFDPWITMIASNTLAAAAAMFIMEISLLSGRARNARQDLTDSILRASKKARAYVDALRPHVELDQHQQAILDKLDSVTVRPSSINDDEAIFRDGAEWIRVSVSGMRAMASQSEIVVNEFGRRDKRIKFQAILWYDIIDSRGRKSKLTRPALIEHRRRVVEFKDKMAEDLLGMENAARSTKQLVYPFQGTIWSKDDEKHIFVTGPNSSQLIQQAAKMVLARAHAHGVRLRVLAIKTTFAGDPAYKYETDPDVRGPTFWEHLTELKAHLRAWETRASLNKEGLPPEKSFFWVAGDLIGTLNFPREFVSDRRSEVLETEVDNVTVCTEVRGGPVNWPRARIAQEASSEH